MNRFFSSTARNMSSKRISYKVEGEVQGALLPFFGVSLKLSLTVCLGVNFRSFTVKQAKSIGVTGFVQNASDGSVVGEAQGDESSLKEFVQYLNKGPSAASVNGVEQNDIDTKSGESDFSQK